MSQGTDSDRLFDEGWPEDDSESEGPAVGEPEVEAVLAEFEDPPLDPDLAAGEAGDD